MRNNLENGLRDGISTIAAFLPKLVLFLVILIIGLLIAKAISKAANALLEKAGFDRAVERGGVKKALAGSKMDASDIVAKLVYYALALFVLQLAFGVFGPNPISDLLTEVIRFIPSLVVGIIILVVASAIAAAVKVLVENTLGGLSYGRTLANIASIFILFLGIVAALNQVGVATTVTTPVLVAILATVAGVIIVGVGGGLIKPMQHLGGIPHQGGGGGTPHQGARGQRAERDGPGPPGRCPRDQQHLDHPAGLGWHDRHVLIDPHGEGALRSGAPLHAFLIRIAPFAVEGSTTLPFWVITTSPRSTRRRAARRAGSISPRQVSSSSPPTARAASEGQIVAVRARWASRSRMVASRRRSTSLTPRLRHEVEQ
ncbi:hypothetical protein JI751_12440 [Nocardioides sp. G10]|uniref:Uncharacterized protein n=1 Tax=Nocardioides baculatus TaxID=2801337 RepID=A0ABS1LA67_9ACTN|nr:hypothetical protein [Nocardioides baculatus]MBL0748422.1 hypothetical protein [Nocardioides baculatus]